MSISLPPLHLSHTISYRITSYGIWRTYVPLFVTISQAPIPPPTYAYPDPPSVLRLPKTPQAHDETSNQNSHVWCHLVCSGFPRNVELFLIAIVVELAAPSTTSTSRLNPDYLRSPPALTNDPHPTQRSSTRPLLVSANQHSFYLFTFLPSTVLSFLPCTFSVLSSSTCRPSTHLPSSLAFSRTRWTCTYAGQTTPLCATYLT